MSEVIEKVVNQIAEFNQFDANLIEFKKQYTGVVYDLTDPKQDMQARSDRLSIGKVISALDKKHKEIKAPLKVKTDLIDSERKRIKDELIDVQLLIKSQIEKHEKELEEKAIKLQAMVSEISALAEFDEFYSPNSSELEERIVILASINIDDSYEHREADATLAQVKANKKLFHLQTVALESEEKERKLKKLQDEEAARIQAERDEVIRKKAAEQAKLEAEQKAEKDRIEAERKAKAEIEAAEQAKQKAISDAKKAEERAERQAEQARKDERERIQRAQEIEAAKAADAEKKETIKKEKQAHRLQMVLMRMTRLI
jgi:hypothetical protein